MKWLSKLTCNPKAVDEQSRIALQKDVIHVCSLNLCERSLFISPCLSSCGCDLSYHLTCLIGRIMVAHRYYYFHYFPWITSFVQTCSQVKFYSVNFQSISWSLWGKQFGNMAVVHSFVYQWDQIGDEFTHQTASKLFPEGTVLAALLNSTLSQSLHPLHPSPSAFVLGEHAWKMPRYPLSMLWEQVPTKIWAQGRSRWAVWRIWGASQTKEVF